MLLLLLEVNHGLPLCYFREGVLQLELGFLSAEKRAAWEMAFTDAKNKLCKQRVPGGCIIDGWTHFIFQFLCLCWLVCVKERGSVCMCVRVSLGASLGACACMCY